MSVESEAAETAIRITMDGTEKMILLSGKAAALSGKLLIYLTALLSQKSRVRQIAENPTGMCTATIPEEKVKEFAVTAKKYNLKFFIAKDKLHDPGFEDICVKAEDAPVVKRICEKLKIGIPDQQNMQLQDETIPFEQVMRAYEGKAMDLDRAINRITERDYAKDTPCYVCERTNPHKYIQLETSRESFHGEAYTRTKYHVYKENQYVKTFDDGKFEGRSITYWRELKEKMLVAGGLSGTDLLFFSEKEPFEQYQAKFEQSCTALEPKQLKEKLEAELNAFRTEKENCANPRKALAGKESGHGQKVGKSMQNNNGTIHQFVSEYHHKKGKEYGGRSHEMER
ncbi:DUF3801 domain-containing protein [Zhenpiania hominis]|uniref:PcfB family protein n=1 Tax=Zhenpiania hominis TaxID=2763644 RepID=A0A923NK49_9FIRM|nr:DUF3801 domain-containing protein [Zhenpiania hominis]MBC6679552.1 PcfB family protein [Zhenpiania hominis]